MWTMTSAARCRSCFTSANGWPWSGWSAPLPQRGPCPPFSASAATSPPAQIFLSRAPMRMGFVHPMLKKLPEPLHSALLYPPFSPQTPPSPSGRPISTWSSAGICFSATLFESMEPFLRLIGRPPPTRRSSPSRSPSTAWPRRPGSWSICVRRRKTVRRSLPSLSCGPALMSRTTSTGPSAWRTRAAG